MGQYDWPDNRSYLGQYAEEVKEGYGIYRWADGRIYKGYWKNGKQQGFAQIEMTGKNSNVKETRYTCWEEGKKILTFDVDSNSELSIEK